ncbi:pyridoxine 5'-phosphate synthase [bacterium]|nr:pyridoxine 5'-phosphate synthase [bacterium]
MARLGIHVEQVALLRNGGCATEADPVKAAVYAELGGCDGIVCAIRKGFTSISERDLRVLKEVVTTHLNVQVAAEDRLVNAALSVRPDMITLMSGRDSHESGNDPLDILGHQDQAAQMIEGIRSQDIIVSVLTAPEILQIKAAAKAGADYVELHLGSYAAAASLSEKSDALENLKMVALAAAKLGLGVSVSQGITYQNVADIAAVEAVEEINVGGSVIGRSLWIGMEAAVRDMAALVK